MIRFLILFLLISTININAQLVTIAQDKIPPSQKMILEVKVISQFYERFNFKETPGNQLLDSVFKSGISRKNNISLLFSPNDIRLDSTSKEFSKAYLDTVVRFIEMVCDSANPVFINKFSNHLIAELICQISINSKPYEIKLWLQLIEAEKKSYKWIILNAQGGCLEIKKNGNNSSSLSPMDDETNFISLGIDLNKKSNLASLTNSTFESEPLNNFLFGMQSGFIQFQSVKDLTYHILDIDGWDIQVKDIQNKQLLNGWLITNLHKFDTDRIQYIKEFTGIDAKP